MTGHPAPQPDRLQTSTSGLRRREAALAVLAGVDGVRRTPEEAAAQALAVGLGYKWAAVCRHEADDAEAEMLAFWDGGRFGDARWQRLSGTPYEALAANDGGASFERGVRREFPDDALLAARGAEAYRGRIVHDPETGRVTGHVFAFDDASDTAGADDLVEVVARWIGMEFSRVRALQTLADSEARFRDWAHASSDWFWEADTEHRFTSMIGRTDRPLRLGTLERLVGMTPWEIPGAWPEDDPTWVEHKAAIRARRPFRDLIVAGTTEDGAPFVTSSSGVPVIDDGGAFRGYRGATRDVTEQYLARREIERAEQRFRDVMEGAPIPITIVGKRSGHVIYGNPKWREMTGVAECELGTVTVFEFYQDATERQELMRRLEREGDVRSMPVTFHGRDGTTLPVLLSAQLIDHGGEEAVISAFVDIREQLEIEAALRESEQRYALAMLGSGESLWDWKTGEDQIFLDPRLLRALGLPDDSSRVGAETLLDRIHPEDRPAYDDAFRRALSGRSHQQIEIEFRMRMGDGGYRWYRGRAMPLRNAEGRVYRFAGSVADITEQKLAAQALRESEERYALAMEGAGEHLWDWHAGGEALFVDPRILIRMGFPSDPPTISRHVLLAAVHPDDRGAYVAAFQDHLRGHAPQFDVEFRLRMADGGYRWHRCRGVALRDDSGRVYRVAGSTADIAERKAAEQALRESEERYALAMAGASEHLWDWSTDSDTFFVDPRVLRLIGLPDEPPVADRKAFLGLVHPDDRVAVRDAFAAHLRGAAPQINVEFRLPTPDGYRWHRARGLALRDDTGRAYRVAGSAADITAEREAQEALRQSEERYRTVFELGPTGMVMLDLERRYIAVNDQFCHMLGYTQDELLGRRLEDFTHPEDRDMTVKTAEQAFQGSARHFRIYKRYIRKNGATVHAEVVGSPVDAADGTPLYGIAIIQDITERVEAASALKEKDERLAALQHELQQVARASAMGEMASAIAHEVNQPLAAVMNYVQAARDMLDAAEDRQLEGTTGLLDKAGDQAERAATIIRGLRNFFVRGQLERSEEDLNELIEDTVSLALGQGQGSDAAVTLELVLDDDLPRVAIDRIQIQQVVLNLVRNAVEAMRTAPAQRLAVRTRAAGGRIEVEVEDSGCGIPDPVLERLFEPFVTSKPDGMGMGLSIAHSIVRAHGGMLEAAAASDGGTVFRFSIPLSGARV